MAKFGEGLLKVDRSTWGICTSGLRDMPENMSNYSLASELQAKQAMYDCTPSDDFMHRIEAINHEINLRVARGTWEEPKLPKVFDHSALPVVKKTDEQIMAEMALRQFFLAAGL